MFFKSLRINRLSFLKLSSICILVSTLLFSQQDQSSSNPAIRPASSKGILPIKNGQIDAVRATLDLQFPVSPGLPGRIPGRFSWNLRSWDGRGHFTQGYLFPNELNLKSSIRPINWHQYRGNPGGYTLAGPRVISFDLFGNYYSFFPINSPGNPIIYSTAEIKSWIEKRGGNINPNCQGYILYASADGTNFYMEGYENPIQNFDSCEPLIIFRAAIIGEQAIWWNKNTPNITYISNPWGDLISYSEELSATSPYLVGIIKNENDPTEYLRMEIKDGAAPLTVNSIYIHNDWVFPYGRGFDPGFIGKINLPPFSEIAGFGKISYTNSLGIAPVEIEGFIELNSDYYIVSIDGFPPQDDFYYTGIVDPKIRPTRISTQSNLGTTNTEFNWVPLHTFLFDRLEIIHPSGLQEKIFTTTDLPINLWGPDTYFTTLTARDLSSGLPTGDGGHFSGFFHQGCLPIQDQPVKNENFAGITRVTLSDGARGQTTLITHVLPRINYSGGCDLNAGLISFSQPQHVTNILTYSTTEVTSISAFRGIRLVHAGGKPWTGLESQGKDGYLFYSSAVLESQEIYGVGAPYSTASGREAMVGGQDWDPTGYTIERTTRFDGWELQCFLNPSGDPVKTVNPVAQKITTVVGSSGVPRLPVKTAILGSRDAWGPTRSDHFTDAPGTATFPQPIPRGTLVPSYQWNSELAGVSGSIQETEQSARVWDAVLGRLVTNTTTTLLDGTGVGAIREGLTLPFQTKFTQYRYDDPKGRVTESRTTRGNTVEWEVRDYTGSGNGNVPSSITKYLQSPDLGTPSFSGQMGTSYVLVGGHNWVQSETDLLTQRKTSYPTRNAMGQPLSSKDESSGITIRFEYDDLGRVFKRTREAKGLIGAEVTEFHYDPSNRWEEEIYSAEGKTLVTRTEFDAFGRIEKVVRPDGSSQISFYDDWGQLQTRSPWLVPGECTYGDFTFSYDTKGRLTQEVNPKKQTLKSYPLDPAWGTLTADGQIVTGTLTTVLDDRGNGMTEVRDLLGQRIAVMDELGQMTRFTFDKWGNLSGTNNGGQIRRYTYTDGGWLSSRLEPEEGLTTFSDFTVLGKARITTLKGRSQVSSSTLTTVLDAKHRPFTVQTSGGGVQTLKTLLYREDFSVVRRLSEDQPNGQVIEDYAYDDIGRQSGKTVSDGTRSFAVSRVLGAGGHPKSQTLSPGNGLSDQIQTFDYDTAFRPYQTKFNCQVKGLMTYNQVTTCSPVDTLTYGNGVTTRHVRTQGELVRTEHATVPGPMLASGLERNDIAWTPGGLMLSRGGDGFDYDGLGRLQHARTLGALGETAEQWFQYDRFGNRTGSDYLYTSPVGGLPKPEELLAWQGAYSPSTNDLPTNVTAITPGSARATGTGTSTGNLGVGAQVDDFGRIVSLYAVPGLETSRTTWEYDAAGRIHRDWISGVPTTFVLDAQGLRFKRSKLDGSTQYTIYGFNREPLMVLQLGTDGKFTFDKAMVYAFGQLISEESPAGSRYIQSDQVGSPNLITDERGIVTGRAKNLPFGERFGQSGDKSIRRFTNHEDTPGSAIYMQARTYLPVLGRFAQVDPVYDQKIYTKDSWNLYGYTSNNPITNTDPTGEEDAKHPDGDQASGGRTSALVKSAEEQYQSFNLRYGAIMIKTLAISGTATDAMSPALQRPAQTEGNWLSRTWNSVKKFFSSSSSTDQPTISGLPCPPAPDPSKAQSVASTVGLLPDFKVGMIVRSGEFRLYAKAAAQGNQSLAMVAKTGNTFKKIGQVTRWTAFAVDGYNYGTGNIGGTHFGVNLGFDIMGFTPAAPVAWGYGLIDAFYPGGSPAFGRALITPDRDPFSETSNHYGVPTEFMK